MSKKSKEAERLSTATSQKDVQREGKISISPRSASAEGSVSRLERAHPKRTITFGSVTTEYVSLDNEEKDRNIKAGQLALARAKSLIVQPGVTIKVGSTVPLYHADPDQPDQLIRVRGTKRDRGTFVNGKFKVLR